MHRYGDFDAGFLSTLDWNPDAYPKGESSAAQFFRRGGENLTYSGLVEDSHPLALLMKANIDGNPTWNASMNGIHAQI